MFIHHRTKGLILKKEDRGETNRVFIVFTQDFGKLELLAKAERKIKSKLRSGLELFYLSDIEFIQGKTQKTITDAILIDDFRNLRRNLIKLSVVHRIADSLDSLVKVEERDDNIWDLLMEVFAKINGDGLKILTTGLAFYYFLWNFFVILGYGPDLYLCFFCRNKISSEDIHFSPKDGGLVCKKCRNSTEPGIDVFERTIKIIRIFLKKDWHVLLKLKIGQEDLKAIKVFSDFYFEEIFAKLS